MAPNIPPDVVRTLATAVLACPDGATLTDLIGAFPAGASQAQIAAWVVSLVQAEILEKDAATGRYYVTSRATPYLGRADTPTAPEPVPGADSWQDAARAAKVARGKASEPEQPLVDVLTPVVATTVREAVTTVGELATPGSRAWTSGWRPFRTSVFASLASAVAKPVAKAVSGWFQSAARRWIIRTTVVAAAALLILAILRLAGASAWIVAPAAVLSLVGVILFAAAGAKVGTAEGLAAVPTKDSGEPEGLGTSNFSTLDPRLSD